MRYNVLNITTTYTMLIACASLTMVACPELDNSATGWRGAVAAGDIHTVAIQTDGSLWAWGDNRHGQLGIGKKNTEYDREANEISPQQVGSEVGTGTNWRAVSAGEAHTVGIKKDGTLWAWGTSYNGRLGNGKLGMFENEINPQPVGSDTWSMVSTGGGHTVGIKKDSTLWAWGSNSFGQLGTGNTTQYTRPQPVGTEVGSGTWKAVASGSLYTIAIQTDGSLWAWGYNRYGQLGYGKTGLYEKETSPQPVGTAKWRAIAAGNTHTVGIQTDGSLWAWGKGYETSPTQVGTSTNWRAAAAGELHTVGIQTDGSLWAWGKGYETSPTQVGTSTNWRAAAAGELHTVGIQTDGSLWAWGYNSHGQIGTGEDTKQYTNPTRVKFLTAP